MFDADFEWDDANRAHLRSHQVTQEEFEQVIRNGAFDLDYEAESGEGRYKSVGVTGKGRILLVVWTVRNGRIRAVTSYRAPKRLQEYFLDNSGWQRS